MTWLLMLLGVVAASSGGGLWWLRRNYLVVTIHGPSMLPTYVDDDRVLVRRKLSGHVRTGDVVVAEIADRAPLVASSAMGARFPVGAQVVKRVAAVAGDPVPPGVNAPDGRVPVGSLVLLGDNPADSSDSRSYGYVPAGQVVGVVLRRLHSADQ